MITRERSFGRIASVRGDRQALLQKRKKLLLTHALAPTCQRGAVEH